MEEQDVIHLLKKYREGTITDAELLLFNSWYNHHAENSIVDTEEAEVENRLKLMEAKLPITQNKQRYLWIKLTAAASVILAISISGYFLLYNPSPPHTLVQNHTHDLLPGGNKAILTLANGNKVTLTGHANGNVAVQGSAKIIKAADGQVSYSGGEGDDKVVYNTLTTPRKGRYSLTLADGTEATLDASSSITYPVAFKGQSREVNITGQVYFKVSHDAAHPFKVTYRGQAVEDIGTEFNINSYNDEPAIKTTLISGSIKIAGQILNRHGQQANIKNNQIKILMVDTDPVTAWKENYFRFDNEDLGSIMRKISRWYDADVVFQNPDLKNKEFGGTMSRFDNVSKVLHKLELTGGVHFEINGNQILVKE